jgi:hypothetical protein
MKHALKILLACSLLSCKKDQYNDASAGTNITLPAYTESGAGTLGFKMDTSIFTIYGAHFEPSMFSYGRWVKNTAITGYNLSEQTHQKILIVSGQLSIVQNNVTVKNYTATLSFTPNPAFPLSTYKLSGSFQSPSGFFCLQKQIDNGGSGGQVLMANDKKPLLLDLRKFDTVGRVCSGRFAGVLYDEYGNSPDSVSITEGRFDIRF